MQMTFTDDDLKRLKRLNDSPDTGAFMAWLDQDRVDALLARLEAAEKVCESCTIEMCEAYYDGGALKEWRKMAGK